MNNDKSDTSEGTILGGFAEAADSDDNAIAVNDYIYLSKDVGDVVMITTPAGDVVVNTGLPGSGGRHKERFAKVSQHPLKFIVLTQCHANQFGGAQELRGPETRVIAQQRYPECRQYWRWLHDFYANRSNKLWGTVLGKDRSELTHKIEEAEIDVLFDDSYHFQLAGRQFELYSTPGGESLDSLVVWLPEDKIAIVGNLFGPIFGHMPNLNTLRGDKIRSAVRFVQSLERVLALQPEMIMTGHEVITGWERIETELELLREAVLYIHDKTIDGMNAGRDVQTLMREIRLPDHLQVGQGHGKVPWCVRAIWEEYAGWFHYDSTTSLYGVPASSVSTDIAELAGGADKLAARAQRYLDEDKPLQAIHLTDIALAADAENLPALQAKLVAHEKLLEQSGNETFSEVMWLKSEIKTTQTALAGLSTTGNREES